jgi:hypothetical protein
MDKNQPHNPGLRRLHDEAEGVLRGTKDNW